VPPPPPRATHRPTIPPPPPRHRTTNLPPLPRPSPTSVMAKMGDPSTRPDQDTFVPTSFDLEQEVLEWESSAVVVMAMRAPATTGVREIEAVVLDEMCLHRREVTVSQHQPEPFLIKFAHRRHADLACKMSCLKHHSVTINVRP
jgi:hypothetical protein